MKKEATNNYSSRGKYQPEAIVLHIMQGTMKGTISWFKSLSSFVSAHYLVGKDGEVVQMVGEEMVAWHAGRVFRPSARGLAVLKKNLWGGFVNPNYYTIGIECEGKSGDKWTEEQMSALVELIRNIMKRWKIDIKRIITHRDIASYKPNLDDWLEEVKSRLIKKEKVDKEEIKKEIIRLVDLL